MMRTANTKETIGSLLRDYHKKRINEEDRPDFSQRELSEEFEIPRELFNKYYNNKRVKKTTMINKIKLAAKLGNKVYEIMGGEPPDIIQEVETFLKYLPPHEFDSSIRRLADLIASYSTQSDNSE